MKNNTTKLDELVEARAGFLKSKRDGQKVQSEAEAKGDPYFAMAIGASLASIDQILLKNQYEIMDAVDAIRMDWIRQQNEKETAGAQTPAAVKEKQPEAV